MNRRVKKLSNQLTSGQAFLITNLFNIRYLLNQPTLFDTHFNGALLVAQDKAVLFADGRYLLGAKEAKVEAELKLIKGKFIPILQEVCWQLGVNELFFEGDNLTYNQVLKFKEELQAVPAGKIVKFLAAETLVEEQRQYKDEAEVEKIKTACRLAEKIWEQILGLIKPGITEKELALELDYLLTKAGAAGPSFETIVASGPNSALPHHLPTHRKIKKGDFVLVDFGAYLGGYCSDTTRTVVVGKPSAEQEDIFATVQEAHKLAQEAVFVGVEAKEADKQVREFFASKGVEQFFTHNLGHGIGLEVHEKPTLGPQSTASLNAGMVFTLEPGLYFEGFGGVRLEDVFYLSSTGLQKLGTAPYFRL